MLALGDYALWNWSLSANHDVIALVSGMTLIPLLIASVWLLALTGAHLLVAPPGARGRVLAPVRGAPPPPDHEAHSHAP